jgi:hypothetical protein
LLLLVLLSLRSALALLAAGNAVGERLDADAAAVDSGAE